MTATDVVALTHQGFVRIDADAEPQLEAQLEAATILLLDEEGDPMSASRP